MPKEGEEGGGVDTFMIKKKLTYFHVPRNFLESPKFQAVYFSHDGGSSGDTFNTNIFLVSSPV